LKKNRDQNKLLASDYDSSKMKKNLIFSKEENRHFKPDISDIGIDNTSKNLNGNSKNVLYQSNSKYLSDNDQRVYPPTEKQKEPIFESKHATEMANPKINSGLKDPNFVNYQNDSFSIEENYVNNHEENNQHKGK
jgi:hypothetical protein